MSSSLRTGDAARPAREAAAVIDGPWIVGPFGDVWMAADVEKIDGKWRETTPEPRIVASASPTLSKRDEAAVNRLTAAAPDLLRAARLVVEVCNPIPLNAAQHLAFTHLVNAIAKATAASTEPEKQRPVRSHPN